MDEIRTQPKRGFFLGANFIFQLLVRENTRIELGGAVREQGLLVAVILEVRDLVLEGIVDPLTPFSMAAAYAMAVRKFQPFTVGNTWLAVQTAAGYLSMCGHDLVARDHVVLDFLAMPETTNEMLAIFLESHAEPAPILS